MIVGLFDQDMAIYQRLPFNLELMKWATFFKKQRHIVKLSGEFNPHYYSKFIYQKDINDGMFENDLSSYKNLTYGGLAFTNGIYQPMPLDVEMCSPDPYIYRPLQINFSRTGPDREFYNQMIRAQHLRLSLDGKTLWPQLERQLNLADNHRVLYIHDTDINAIDGARDCIDQLAKKVNRSRNPCLIGAKFPMAFYNEDDMLQWFEHNYQNNLLILQFNGLMSDSALDTLIQLRKKSSYNRHFEYVITYGCSTEDDFFINRLPYIYKQVLFLRSHQQKISLKYEPEFFSTRTGANTVRLIEAFCNSQFYDEIDLKYDSLYSFAKHMRKNYKYESTHIIQDEAREVFQFIREKNYDLFKQFYELHTVELKGGKLYDTGGNFTSD